VGQGLNVGEHSTFLNRVFRQLKGVSAIVTRNTPHA